MSKTLSAAEWVKLAASKDQARPVLCAVHVTDKHMEATDSYRLHRAPAVGLAPGLWDVKTGTATDGQYPTTDAVMPAAEWTHTVTDIPEFRGVVAAAVAFCKAAEHSTAAYPITLPAADGSYVGLNAMYLADVLRGLGPYTTLHLRATGPLHPVLLEVGGMGLALLMPIRLAPGKAASARFDVSGCLAAYTASDVTTAA